MGSQVLGYVRRHHLALVALFVALGGTSYAAISLPRNSVGAAEIKRNAVRSAEVRDRSLLRRDFRRGQLPAGPQGATGAQGPQGPQGPAGPVDPSAFVQNQSASAQSGSFFLNGTLRSTGALRLGSETGTTQGPNFPTGSNGLVIRRVFSSIVANDQVVARVGPARFERNGGSTVAFNLDNSDGTDAVDVDCFGVAGPTTGAVLVKKAEVGGGEAPLLFSGGDVADAFTCSFLYLAGSDWHQTQVTMQRFRDDNVWIGTLISTDNQ